MSTEKFNVNASLSRNYDHLQKKYIGTGRPTTTKYEWAEEQLRDSLCSYVGSNSMLSYFAIAENESKQRVKARLMDKMVTPVQGPKPAVDLDLDEDLED